MTDTAATVVVGLTSAIFGAGFWGFVAERFKFGLSAKQGEVERLRADLAKCEERHEALERREAERDARIDKLENQLRVVEHSQPSYLARWIKDDHKRLIWCNDKAFLTIFAPLGLSRQACEGKTFHELLIDKPAAEEIDMLDTAALAHPGAVESALIQMHPMLRPMIVLKVAATGSRGELIFEGYAYHASDPEIRSAAGSRRQLKQIEASMIDRLPGD